MQITYAFEQEHNLRQAFGPDNLSLHDRGVVRVAILDDQYIGAPGVVLAQVWGPFKGKLADSGHTVEHPKPGRSLQRGRRYTRILSSPTRSSHCSPLHRAPQLAFRRVAPRQFLRATQWRMSCSLRRSEFL